MRWRKKANRVDFSTIDLASPERTSVDWRSLADGAPVEVSLDGIRPPPVLSREAAWRYLGESGWDLLANRPMSALWPNDTLAPFQRYVELLRRSPNYRSEFFIGLRHGTHQPMFMPRKVLKHHGYILGASGSGKTSEAIAQILIQLPEPFDWLRRGRYERAPILIIDMKPNGDRYLRALAECVAAEWNRPFRFFSNKPEYVSLKFDPFYCLRAVGYPLQLAETLLKSFSMIYPEGYGSDFFTAEQRVELQKNLYEQRPSTLQSLIDCIGNATRGVSGNKDARGLYSALAPLGMAMNVIADGSAIPDDDRIDFDRFFDEQEILYVHLDSRGTYLLSRDIGRLLLFALLETASQRERLGQKRQSFAIIDEFHRLAAHNVVEMLEDARGSGVGLILAHQSSSSLRSRDADMYGILFENCSFKQCLTLEDPRVIDLLRLISGRQREIRHGGFESETQGSTYSRGTSDSSYSSTSESSTYDGWGRSSTTSGAAYGRSSGHNYGEAYSKGVTRGSTWKEEMVPGLTPEMIVEVNANNLLSLIHIKGFARVGHTPTGGVPTLVQGLYPLTEKMAEEFEDRSWPSRTVDREEYYGHARPRVSEEVVQAAQQTAEANDAPSRTRDDGLRRQLEDRIRGLAERLAGQMVGEMTSVQRLARRRNVGVAQILEIARGLNIQVAKREDLLKPTEVDAIEEQLKRAGLGG